MEQPEKHVNVSHTPTSPISLLAYPPISLPTFLPLLLSALVQIPNSPPIHSRSARIRGCQTSDKYEPLTPTNDHPREDPEQRTRFIVHADMSRDTYTSSDRRQMIEDPSSRRLMLFGERYNIYKNTSSRRKGRGRSSEVSERFKSNELFS